MNALPEPTLTELDQVGPQHAKYHVMECKVSTFTTDGGGKTKNIAKQIAAQRMIEKIVDAFELDSSKATIQKQGSAKVESQCTVQSFSTIADCFENKSTHNFKNNKFDNDVANRLKSNINAPMAKLQYALNLIHLWKQDKSEENMNKVKQEFQRVLDSAQIEFYHMTLQTIEPVTFMLIMQLDTTPDIIELSLGRTREEAEMRTMNKILEKLKSLLE